MTVKPWVLSLILLASPIAARGQAPPTPRPGSTDDEKAIRGVIDQFGQAFAKGDAKAIAGLFTEQGEAIDPSGQAIRGRAEMEAHYAERFAANPGDTLETTIELIHFLAPEVARQDGRTRLVHAGGKDSSTSKYTATFAKTQGRWLVASVRELEETQAITPHDRLKELEWFVGDWVEETGDARIQTKTAWSDDGQFLLRSFEVHVQGKPEVKGTQRIGWDPLRKQIRSWVFDSKGGYGDGVWHRNGDHWTIKATGVHADGLTTSATQTLTRLSNDRLLWTSNDRTLGDETQPDVHEITMVRKPPEPK